MTAAVIPASFPSPLLLGLFPPCSSARSARAAASTGGILSPDEEAFLVRCLLYVLMDDSYRKYLCDIKYKMETRGEREEDRLAGMS